MISPATDEQKTESPKYKRFFSLFILGFLFLGAQVQSAEAQTTRYVDTDCANNGDGTASTCAASGGAAGAYTSWNNAKNDIIADFLTPAAPITVYMAGTAADTTAVSANGQTLSAANYIRWTCDPGKGDGCNTTGIWSTSHYRLSTSDNTTTLDVNDPYWQIVRLQIEQTGGGDANSHRGISFANLGGGDGPILLGNIIRCSGTCSSSPGSGANRNGVYMNDNSAGNMIVVNNLIYGFADKQFQLNTSGFGAATYAIYNNTFYGGAYGLWVYADGGPDTGYIKNNLLCGSSSGDYFKTAEAWTSLTTGNNVTCDTSSPDASYRSATISWVNQAGGDYHLQSSDSGAKDRGADLSADAIYSFSTDIDTDSRSGSWDVGADEYYSAATPTPTPTATATATPTPTPGYVSEICGDGIDNDNSGGSGWGASITGHAAGDVACTGLVDNDRDGYASSADCDDTNRYIFPSDYTYHTSGCGGGQVRKCQANGTYSSCAAWSCPGSNCYYFDPVGGSNANPGTLASPWKDLDRISNGCTGNCRTPQAGDVFVLRSGTFVQTGQQATVTGKSGSSGNPIVIMAYPGEAPVIDSSGTTETYIIEAVQSDYWRVEGITFRDNYGDGIFIDDSDNWEIVRVYCQSHRGGTGDNRNCFKTASGSSNIRIRNSLIADSGGVYFFSGTGNRFDHNVAYGNDSSWSRAIVGYKFGAAGSVFEADHNIIFNIFDGAVFGQPGIWTGTGAHIHDNLFHTTRDGAIEVLGDPGGPAFLVDIQIDHNTIIYPQDGAIRLQYISDPGIDDRSGPITINNNLVVDDAANYTGDAGLVRVSFYDSNADYTYWNSSSRLVFNDNCYYNASVSGLTGAFNYFSAGESYGGEFNFTQWQTAPGGSFTAGAGQDTAGFNSNPTLGATNFFPTAACLSQGWRDVSAGGSGSGGNDLLLLLNAK